MSGQITPASLLQDEADDEGVPCSARPPVLGQEHLDVHLELAWKQEQYQQHSSSQLHHKSLLPSSNNIVLPLSNSLIINNNNSINTVLNRPESSLSEIISPTSNSDEQRPVLCGQSITPSSQSDSCLTENVPSDVSVRQILGTNESSSQNRSQILTTSHCNDSKSIQNFEFDLQQNYHQPSTKCSSFSQSEYPRTSPCFDSQPSSLVSQSVYFTTPVMESSAQNRSSLDFQVPGSVPVQFDCLPESDPHVNLRPWLRWALALHYLLHDAKGVNLFRKYLLTEGKQHVDALEFWFAVEGLHGQITPETVAQLVKVIYRRYFTKAQLPIEDKMRRDVAQKYKITEPQMLADLFDVAQNHVETLMRQTTYPNFLKSDIYLDYVQSMQNVCETNDFPMDTEIGACGGLGFTSLSSGANGSQLPTVHEDSELITDNFYPIPGYIRTGQRSPPLEPLRLTKDSLLQTQKRRALEVRPKSETLAGVPPIPISTYHHHHPAYTGYNPVSRVDSELQSLSSHSDARTESDSMSITDISSIDGSIHQRSVRRKQARQVREAASVNRESASSGHILIPRTQRPPRDHWKPLPPNEFAKQLTEKLEHVLKERDAQEQLDRKLHELFVSNESRGDLIPANLSNSIMQPPSEVPARALAAALKEKLKLDDDNDQDILDQHVSRVWAEVTPNRSPGRLTPQVAVSRQRGLRKDRDVHSTFSSDSGNVMDFAESTISGIPSMVKSKSMGDYCHENERYLRMGIHRRSSSKKTLTDLTDSGVSVVSDTIPIPGGSSIKDNRVLSWLLESDRTTKLSQNNSVIPNSPTASRYRKGHSHSRSSSLERGSTASNPSITQQTTILPAASTLPIERGSTGDHRRRGEPSQPFIADPNMPPLPPPHTPSQLEEARRRLLEGDTASRSRFKDTSSSQSTLRKTNQPISATTTATKSYTTVVFNFCDEQFPYRTKIPSIPVTLKQFKDYLPKKGNYRYFFKTASVELDNQVIQEEIICDSDILPLWEGKIMAQVKPVD